MRKLKLFFACMLMAVLSIGQVWGAEQTVSWNASSGALGSAISSVNGTAQGTISTGSFSWNYTRTLKVLKSGKSDYVGMSGSYIQLGSSNAGEDVEFRTSNIPGTIKSVTVLAGSKDTRHTGTITVGGTDYNAGAISAWASSAGGNWEGTGTSSGEIVISISCNSKQAPIYIASITVVYEEGSTQTCATPTFTPTSGDFAGSINVTLACTTEGAAIHYTTDGTEPTASSATYTAAIPVSETTTIQAIAVADGYENSSIASKTYTKHDAYTTIQALFNDKTNTSTPVYVTFDGWKISGVKGSQAFLTDGTKGLIIYQSSHGFVVGDALSGTAACNLIAYKGAVELTGLTSTSTGLTVTHGSMSDAVAKTIDELGAVNTSALVTISNVTYDGTNLSDGTNSIKPYNGLFSSMSFENGKKYNVTGVLNYYDALQIMPRSADDIVEVVDPDKVATPTFSPAAGTYTSAQNVTISCETTGATIHYTTNGDEPTASSTAYSGAIEVGESMTIKAIAVKDGLDDSNVASALYTINLPLPEHTFQVTHHFSTGEGFEFPTGWGGSYAEHEISYTDDKVHFASASKQTGTITDRPVVKEGAISLILTNSSKLISAVRFDYIQWSDKVPTLTMKYSTDGGETYSNFDPVVSTTDFALQVLTMPEGVNAIQVVGTANKQTGLTSIAFDLVDKPIVTKTVTIIAPTNGTLTVMNGENAISSGDAIEVGTVLTITATPSEGYKLTEVTVNESAYAESTLTLTENVTIAASFEENVAPDVESYVLSEIGVEIPQSVSGLKVGDKVNLPLTATECSKVFRGWSANASCAVAPEFAPGAEITLAANNKFYAVYADVAGSTWNVATSVEAGDVIVISTNTGYTAHDMKTAGAISGTILGATASTYGSENATITELAEGTLQFTVGGNATDGWTLMNGTKYLAATAAKKVALQDAEATWSIEFTGNVATVTYSTSSYGSLQYNYNSGDDRFTSYASAQVAISLYKQVANYENYSTDCQAAVATPTFLPAAGTYTSAQNVTISCETTGATIHYTTNGDEPTASSTAYSGAIEVGESMTIKAIAVKSGMANSAIASATYTINLPLSTMDQIFAAATAAGSTATDANIAFGNWVVSGISTNGKNVFVTDGSKGFIIFDNGGEMGFAVGNVLSGTVACKVQLYNGSAELTTLSSSTEGLNVATGGVITPVAKAISELGGINTGAPVIINSVQFDGEYLRDGANSIKPYNALYNYDALTENTYYNVTGIYQQFGATKEILPRSAADIEALVLDDPELSYDPASVSLEVGQALSAPTFNNPHTVSPINYAVSGDAVATVTDEGVIALVENATGTAVITASFAGNAQYAAGNATFTITVSEPVDAKNVVIIAEYDSKFYALTNSISNKTAAAVEVEKDGSNIIVTNAEAKAAIQWKKITDGENTTFQDADDKYLKGASNGGDLTVADAVCNWSWNATDEYYYIGTRSFIYRESANGFKNYAVQNAGTSDYSALAEVIEIDPENIVITSKVDPQLAYTPAEITLTVGNTFTPAVLSYAEGFDGLEAVTYASNNEAVATVNEIGVVSLVADATGTATITATFAGNSNYLAGNASYTITVNEVGDDLSGVWVLASSVAAGDKIIIAGTYNSVTKTMGKQNANNRAAVESSLAEKVLTPGAATKVFTLVDAGDGKFAIQASNGKYLTSATSGTDNKLLEADDYENDNAKWTISINEQGVASVVAAAGSKKDLQYNNSNAIFSCYTSGNQRPINIYKNTYTRNVTDGRYGTICLPYAGNISGATLYRIADYANSMIYIEEVGEEMEAGKPYIFQATSDKLNVVYTSATEEEAGNANGLYGSYTEKQVTANDGNYILYQNQYWFVNSEAYVRANCAYIKIGEIESTNQAPGRRRVAMTVHGEQVATDIDALNASEAPVKMIIDGQLYILRGEKMFDATGRMVK